jgi:hypothetical protein
LPGERRGGGCIDGTYVEVRRPGQPRSGALVTPGGADVGREREGIQPIPEVIEDAAGAGRDTRAMSRWPSVRWPPRNAGTPERSVRRRVDYRGELRSRESILCPSRHRDHIVREDPIASGEMLAAQVELRDVGTRRTASRPARGFPPALGKVMRFKAIGPGGAPIPQSALDRSLRPATRSHVSTTRGRGDRRAEALRELVIEGIRSRGSRTRRPRVHRVPRVIPAADSSSIWRNAAVARPSTSSTSRGALAGAPSSPLCGTSRARARVSVQRA